MQFKRKNYRLKKSLIQKEFKNFTNDLIKDWIKFSKDKKSFKSVLSDTNSAKLIIDNFNKIKIADFDIKHESNLFNLGNQNIFKIFELDSKQLKNFPESFEASVHSLLICSESRSLKKNEIEDLDKFIISSKKKYLKKYSISKLLFRSSI